MVKDTGWRTPGTVVGVWAGGNNWSNPDNVKVDDATSAGWTGAKFTGNNPGDGPELKCSNFGFTIPLSAKIIGIELQIKGKTNNLEGELAYLTQLGTPTIYGKDKREDWPPVSEITSFIYGNDKDLWGASNLTPSIINANNFGWIFMPYDSAAPLSVAIRVMQIKVYYEEKQAAGMMGAGF